MIRFGNIIHNYFQRKNIKELLMMLPIHLFSMLQWHHRKRESSIKFLLNKIIRKLFKEIMILPDYRPITILTNSDHLLTTLVYRE